MPPGLTAQGREKPSSKTNRCETRPANHPTATKKEPVQLEQAHHGIGAIPKRSYCSEQLPLRIVGVTDAIDLACHGNGSRTRKQGTFGDLVDRMPPAPDAQTGSGEHDRQTIRTTAPAHDAENVLKR